MMAARPRLALASRAARALRALHPAPPPEVDVIVVGGGHAGCEAAAAAARTGALTLLLTQRKATVGEMSCNPSIGGVGKGHLVREIDALDGLMARCADQAGIHFRLLNRSKGPAVRGPRAQADRDLYKAAVQRAVGAVPRLRVVEAAVDDLIVRNGEVAGVVTSAGESLFARAVVLTAGTFLRGTIHIGRESRPAGRMIRDSTSGEVEAPTVGLAATLQRMELPLARLKTGTPPRLDGRTVTWRHGAVLPQPSESPPVFFAYENAMRQLPLADALIDCYKTQTTEETHEIVRRERHQLPLYESGEGDGAGPRYCPSLPSKVSRFADRDSHVVWLEPEGLSTHVVYPNGISGAFPLCVQQRIVNSIPGLEECKIIQPGYDVEYDFIDARSLSHSLQVRECPGLFLAGQIIGTTGYEEAASLGLMAGINAALHSLDRPAFLLQRHEAYVAVLIDDLVTKGTMEPYRMFTSRAEHRLLLRCDNADARLTIRGYEIGAVGRERVKAFRKKVALTYRGEEALNLAVFPMRSWAQHFTPGENTPGAGHGPPRSAAWVLAKYPSVSLEKVESWVAAMRRQSPSEDESSGEDARSVIMDTLVPAAARETVEVSIKYADALQRQERSVQQLNHSGMLRLPADFDYSSIGGLSAEEVQKLTKMRPISLAEARSISGITPAGAIALMDFLNGRNRREKMAQTRSRRLASWSKHADNRAVDENGECSLDEDGIAMRGSKA